MRSISSPASSVRRTLALALDRLEAAADPQVALRSRSFFKPHERVQFLGVTTPALRRIERELYHEIRHEWTVDDAVRFCDAALRRPQVEARALGLILLGRYRRRFERSLFAQARAWLDANRCDNWALVDTLSPSVLTPLLDTFPALHRRIASWIRSPNLWVRRAALVAYVPLARRGCHLDEAYAVAQALLPDREDLIHKATGWLLREAGTTHTGRLIRFLLAHGPHIPRTTLRYAIERLPESARKRLLRQTRSDNR